MVQYQFEQAFIEMHASNVNLNGEMEGANF